MKEKLQTYVCKLCNTDTRQKALFRWMGTVPNADSLDLNCHIQVAGYESL